MDALSAFNTGNTDYEPMPYSILFPAGIKVNGFKIEIIDDNIFEDTESFSVVIDSSSLPSGVGVAYPSEASVLILDDDSKCACCLSLTIHRQQESFKA